MQLEVRVEWQLCTYTVAGGEPECYVPRAVYFIEMKQQCFKGSLQWKNDLGLYFTLVLVMKIGMCDLMIFRLV